MFIIYYLADIINSFETKPKYNVDRWIFKHNMQVIVSVKCLNLRGTLTKIGRCWKLVPAQS